MINTTQLQITELVLHDRTMGNPFSGGGDAGALENWYMNNGKLVRVAFPPLFHASAAASPVWRIVPFVFTRDGAPENQLLIFKANGCIYRRRGGEETKIYPYHASDPLISHKPAVAQVQNRLHISDASQYLIYDGWTFVNGGLTPPTAPVTSLSGTGLTGDYTVAASAVHIRENDSSRVHESNRSDLAVVSPANQSIVFAIPANLPARATHWSVYASEVAGSGVIRRVATLPLTTTSYTMTTDPPGTAPEAPIRNDPVQRTRTLTAWKNRIASRSEMNPDQFWFTAFGEVEGLLNGAGDECLPGRSGISISDLVNSWTIPGGHPMQTSVWHDEFLFVFTDAAGFYIQGEGALLDSRSLRDFFPQKQFAFGSAGPFSACSTPHGLVVLSPERKLWLWDGRADPDDVGYDIQDRLNGLTADELTSTELLYWSGEGFEWLLLNLSDRLEILDFAVTTEKSPRGTWFSVGSQGGLPAPTSLALWNLDGRAYLLSGHTDGSVRLQGQLCQPSHLGLSFNLGETYLSATVQPSLPALARTGLLFDGKEQWTEAKWGLLYAIGDTDNDSTGARVTVPTITIYYDRVNAITPTGGVAQAPALEPSGFYRWWFKRSSAASAIGALCKRFQVEITKSTTDTDGQARPQLVNDELYVLTIGWLTRSNLAL